MTSNIRAELAPSIIDRTVQMVRYKIVITKYTNEFKVVPKSWEQGASDDGEHYGYTPAIENIVEVSRTILEQQVDTLDLTTVIMAVNNILTDIPTMTNRQTLIDLGWTPPDDEGIPG